jgi:hypothetical protein
MLAGFYGAAVAELTSGSITNAANSLLTALNGNLDTQALAVCMGPVTEASITSPTVTVSNTGTNTYSIAVDGTLSTGGTFASTGTYNTGNGTWSTSASDTNTTGYVFDETALTESSTGITSVEKGLNSSGATTYEQDTGTPADGATSASISGSGDDTTLSDASISLAASAQAAIDGADNAVSLAANAALTLGAAAAGNAVTIGGSGTSVDMSGAGGTVGSGTTTIEGSEEQVSFTTVGTVSVATGTQTSVTGTDGTLTTDTQTGSNPFQNTINWDSSGSQIQLIAPSSGVVSDFENFGGSNGTGTNTSNMLDYTAGNSQQQLFTSLPSGDSEQINSYSGPNLTGTLGSIIWDQSAGTSQVETYNPTDLISDEVARGLQRHGTIPAFQQHQRHELDCGE